jgi:membrane-bound metal-dependent hydrolase YbcI (DUF457 family)
MDNPAELPNKEILSNTTVSFGVSLAITSVASALLVIAKEKSPGLMAAMKSTTGHHWATHSIFALGLFLILGLGLTRANGGRGLRMTAAGLMKIVVCGILVGSVIIAGFYMFAD